MARPAEKNGTNPDYALRAMSFPYPGWHIGGHPDLSLSPHDLARTYRRMVPLRSAKRELAQRKPLRRNAGNRILGQLRRDHEAYKPME